MNTLIYLLEEDPALRELIPILVQQEGCHTIALGKREFIVALEEARPSLIIVNAWYLKHNQQLKECLDDYLKLEKLPVILLSTDLPLNLKFDYCLAKIVYMPFDIVAFRETVASLIYLPVR